MKNLRLVWHLWRLVRRVERDAKHADVGASFTFVVEGGGTYDDLVRVAAACGNPPPERRRAWEVNYWPNVNEQATVRRGSDPVAAIKAVLGDR